MKGGWNDERMPRYVTRGATLLFGLMALSLMAVLVVGAWPLLREPRPLTNLMSPLWSPLTHRFGLVPFVAGTIAVTVMALGLAIPVGLGTAITLARLMPQTLQPAGVKLLTVLTAVPSVIFGWWGLLVVVPWIRGQVGGPGFSLLAAGVVLSLMLMPTFSLLYYQALRAVPSRYQEASDALGASPDQTLIGVVLPCAFPALVQGLFVGVARALGETMAVQMVIGGQTLMPKGLAAPGATLTTQILTDVTVFPQGTRGHAVLDLMALLLMVAMYLLVRAAERWGTRS